jgi:putative Mg2+ transporter-C (MgtC) family protein
LVVAAVLGGVIGWDREYRAKEAGLRTHFLVALGSALMMIVSQHAFVDVLDRPGYGLDPSRIAAQVVSGIGFIGAGTILIQKQFVRGLTTAAGLWATAGIGLAVGGGMYWIGVAAMLLTLVGLEFLTVIVKNVGEHSSLLIYSTTIHDNLKKIVDELQAKEYKVSDYEVQREILEHGEIYHVSMVIRTKRHLDESELFRFLQNLPDLTIERLI